MHTEPPQRTLVFRRAGMHIAGALLFALLASCGGGANSPAPAPVPVPVPVPVPQPVAASITGYVDEGPVSGATVKLYRVDAAGAKTLLGSAVTDSRGFYSITNNAPANTSVLIEANGGTYTDEMTGQSLTLAIPMRAAATSNGGAATISVTPYSEVAVRILEHAAKADWSGASIASANAKVAANIGTAEILDFIPINLMGPPPATAPRDNDIGMSFMTSGFSGFAQRVAPNPSTSLGSALDDLYHLFAVDAHDDRLFPAFLGGVTDFVDRSSATDSFKGQLKSLWLARRVTTMTDADLNQFKPTGVSSGGASAPMPDDAFHMVGNNLTGSMFNRRGALIAYPIDNSNGKWRTLFTASAAEVYGDGDVGIGRWNGGATIDTMRAGSELLAPSDLTHANSAQLIPYGSYHYAIARAATNLPSCGMRRLPLVAATLPTVVSTSVGVQPMASGLTPDSSVSFQYATDTLAGFDIGVRALDGSVTRYRSTGGADAPWASGIRLSGLAIGTVALQPVAAGMALSNVGMEVHGVASGNGGTKLVLRLVLGGNQLNPTGLAAAFAAPTGGVDGNGCASAVGDPGTAIAPLPANGAYFVFSGLGANLGANITFRGAPQDAVFRTRGELASIPMMQVGLSTPIYELAGNANASIGRIDGSFTLQSTTYTRSMPYAVARTGAVVPATGSRHYVLVGSTLVVPELDGAPGAELAPGRVQAASLDITFGEYPIGTPSPYYGTARFSVSGSVGGVRFSVSEPGSSGAQPAQSRVSRDGGSFGDSSQFAGSLAAPAGDDVVVRFTTSAGNATVTGTLLFRRQ